MVWTSFPTTQIAGHVRAAADKSCSHRALILAGLAQGESHIHGLLEGEDVLNTARVMQALGAELCHKGPGRWSVKGVGRSGLSQPDKPLDFGNSGTGSRLIMGAVAGYPITARFIGDDSLSSRPMARVLDPLSEMGVSFQASPGQRLPLILTGQNRLKPITYTPPHASAQVKSCLLLAALNTEGETSIIENRPTRDHSEKMLRAFGAELSTIRKGSARHVSLTGKQTLTAQTVTIPGDPSSVAFLAAAAMISPRGGIGVEAVMSNETRDGFFRVASQMGAQIGAESVGEAAGERLIDMSFEAAELSGIDVPSALVPSMIDEFPILAVLAAYAKGVTRITGAAELRVKESDRITSTLNMLRVNGVSCEETPDGFIVEGMAGKVPGGGLVETCHDHRIAMSALILGTAAQAPVSIDDASMIMTSYPEFFEHAKQLGARIEKGQP